LSKIKIIPKIKYLNPNEGLNQFTFDDFRNLSPIVMLPCTSSSTITPPHTRSTPSCCRRTSSITVTRSSGKFPKPPLHIAASPLSSDCHHTHRRAHANWLVLLHLIPSDHTVCVLPCVCVIVRKARCVGERVIELHVLCNLGKSYYKLLPLFGVNFLSLTQILFIFLKQHFVMASISLEFQNPLP